MVVHTPVYPINRRNDHEKTYAFLCFDAEPPFVPEPHLCSMRQEQRSLLCWDCSLGRSCQPSVCAGVVTQWHRPGNWRQERRHPGVEYEEQTLLAAPEKRFGGVY